MSTPHMSINQKIDALALKIVDMQRELSQLHQDVRKVLWMLQQTEAAKEKLVCMSEEPDQSV